MANNMIASWISLSTIRISNKRSLGFVIILLNDFNVTSPVKQSFNVYFILHFEAAKRTKSQIKGADRVDDIEISDILIEENGSIRKNYSGKSCRCILIFLFPALPILHFCPLSWLESSGAMAREKFTCREGPINVEYHFLKKSLHSWDAPDLCRWPDS